MKRMKTGIVDELKEKHKEALARAQKELKHGRPKLRANYDSDVILFMKWAYRVGKGWYGFSLGHIPPVWTDVLDDFLSWLETQCPDFEIHQIKKKFGSLRFYVCTKTNLVIPDEKIRAEISQLENLLRTPQNLRYVQAIERALAARKKRQKPSRAK